MVQSGEIGDFEVLYANLLKVGHNAAEFLLDFGRHFEDLEEQILMRVVTNPTHAKEFAALLSRSIEQYELKYGPIQAPEN